jgi:CheY-like chemotaxis protein
MDIDVERDVEMHPASTPKLLIADDSVTVRKVVELTFADEGIAVTAVGSGEEAMQRFVEIEPDIVLLDVNMPDPTGYHICEMIKQDEATQNIPVLLLVGSFEPFDQDEAERVKADGFIVKPFQSIRDLVAKVNELLGPGKEPHRPAPETSDIDNLYEKSFSVATQEPDAKDDIFLGDAGLDDEIIEMSHPGAITEHYEVDDHPETLADNLESFSAADPDESDPLAGVDWFARPADDVAELQDAPPLNGSVEPFQNDDDPAIFDLDEVDTLRDMEISEPEPEAEFETEAESEGQPEPAREQEVQPQSEPKVQQQEDDEPESLAEAELPQGVSAEVPIQEPSDEFVTLVARRVIEKLSDKVVREIAREAVPRIAENLIREALSDTREK